MIAGEPTMSLQDVSIVADGLDHPECVTVGPDGALWAGGELGQLYRIDPNSGAIQEVASTGGFALGVTLDGTGHAYICDIGKHALMRITIATGDVEPLVAEVEGRALVNPNYAVFAPDGRLYVSDSGHFKGNDGYIFVLERDGSARIFSEEACYFPNGMALDPERGELYIAESTLPAVTKLNLLDAKREVVVVLPNTVPDGVALDEEGTVYCGCYRPDTIFRIKDGAAAVLLADPEGTVIAAPTNLAFGGPDRRSLYIASLGRWHIGMVQLPVPGMRLIYPGA